MSRIISVTPLEGYCLEVMLENGSGIILNLEPRLHTVRFGILADIAFFNKAATDGVCITWEGKIEISLSELFQLAQR